MDGNKQPSPALLKLFNRLKALPVNKNEQELKIYMGILRDTYKQARAEGNSFIENKTKQILRKYNKF